MNFTEAEFAALSGQKLDAELTHKRFRRKDEDLLQEACEDYLSALNIGFIHMKKYVRCHSCGKFHAIGNDKGYPDLTVFFNDGKTVFFELKTIKGLLSPAQKEYKKQLEAAGFTYHVVRDFSTFRELVAKY